MYNVLGMHYHDIYMCVTWARLGAGEVGARREVRWPGS